MGITIPRKIAFPALKHLITRFLVWLNYKFLVDGYINYMVVIMFITRFLVWPMIDLLH